MISYTEIRNESVTYNNLILKRRLLRLRINIFVGGYALAWTRRSPSGAVGGARRPAPRPKL